MAGSDRPVGNAAPRIERVHVQPEARREAVGAKIVVRQPRAGVAEALGENLHLNRDEVLDGEGGVAEGAGGRRVGGVEDGEHVEIVVLVRRDQAVDGVAQSHNHPDVRQHLPDVERDEGLRHVARRGLACDVPVRHAPRELRPVPRCAN